MSDLYGSRLDIIREIALKTGKTFEEVMNVYTKKSSEVYSSSGKLGVMFKIYSPDLEDKVAKLTEEALK